MDPGPPPSVVNFGFVPSGFLFNVPAGRFPSRRAALVRRPSRCADRAPAPGLASHPRGTQRLDRGAHGIGQDPRRLPLRDRLAAAAGERARRRDPRPLRLAPARPVQRRPEESPRAAGRDPGRRREPARGARGRPHRRYATGPAHGDDEEAAAHPGHDAGVAVPAPHQRRRAPDAGHRAHGDRGRDPRPRAGQARLASRALARAAGGLDRTAPAARRPVRHAEAPGRGRAIPGRHRTDLRAGRHRHVPRPRPRHRGPALAAEHGLLARAVGRDLRAHRGAGAHPSHHARVREHAQDGRAHRGPALQAARRGRGGQPSRQPLPRAKAGRGREAQGGPAARDRGHRLPRARHRHRGRGPRDPGRRHPIDRDVPAARRPLRPCPAQDAEGPALPPDPGRARGSGRAPARCRQGHPRPHTRGAARPRHPGPAGGGGLCPAGVAGSAAPRDGEEGLALSRPHQGRAGPGRGHAQPGPPRAPSPRWCRRTAARHQAGADGGAPLRRRDPRYRGLPGPAGAGGHSRRHRQRGLGHRVQRGRHLPARQHVVADPARRDRSRARRRCQGPAADAAVLARGSARPHARAGGGDRVAARGSGRRRQARHVPPGRVWTRSARGRRDPGRRIRRGRTEGAGHGPHPAARRARAVLRRERRHAARRARALRVEDQPRVGTGPAQEVLRGLRLRAAGGRQRGGHRALPRPPAQLRAERRLRVPEAGHGARDPDPGPPGRTHVRDAGGAGTRSGR